MNAQPEFPKGVLRLMLERLLPPGIKGEAICGDLLEEYRDIANRSSIREARAWYRRQTVRILWAVVRGRISRGGHRLGLGVSFLDLKLGLRMLVKYPGLTLVGTLAMFWVMAVSVLLTWFSENLMNPTLPF